MALAPCINSRMNRKYCPDELTRSQIARVSQIAKKRRYSQLRVEYCDTTHDMIIQKKPENYKYKHASIN